VINAVPLPAELAAQAGDAMRLRRRRGIVRPIEEWLAAAGFTDIRITPRPESRELIATWVPGSGIENYVVSAIVERAQAAAVTPARTYNVFVSLHRQLGEKHSRRGADRALGQGTVQGLQRRQASRAAACIRSRSSCWKG